MNINDILWSKDPNETDNEIYEIVKDIDGKLFIVENFIFPETCEFIIKEFSKRLENLENIGKPGILGGPGGSTKSKAHLTSSLNKIKDRTTDLDYNVGIDFFTSICTNIEKTASLIFKKNLVLKSYFYSHMQKGGLNSLHIDNYSEEYEKDYSALLYLSDSYEGGLINFPQLKVKLKPKPGTFVTFIGTKELEHEVEEVSSGDRVNIILFLREKGE